MPSSRQFGSPARNASAAGFFVSIEIGRRRRIAATHASNLERRSARRRPNHCWPCTRERAGRGAGHLLAPLRSPVAEIGHWWEPDKLMGYCVALYFAKLLVWDKVLGIGSTDALAGFAAITANLVVSFYFAKRGFENVARIIKR
jgi:hypothetical protein